MRFGGSRAVTPNVMGLTKCDSIGPITALQWVQSEQSTRNSITGPQGKGELSGGRGGGRRERGGGGG